MSAADTAVLTVSGYAGRIGRAVRQVGGAIVEGEVQRPHASGRGHLYFDLTDGEARLCCKVFSRQAHRLAHAPRHGDLVQVRIARPDFWEVAGKLDVIVEDVRLAGEGELLRRRAELLARLRSEGLCEPERRKPLPRFPRAVGVIAGKGSDGLSDVVCALQDRFPPVHIVTCAALVQGQAAPRDLIDALACLQQHPLVDVIVIARGGGSVQDLLAFDDERLCRAIFACDVPVVAAIGHTNNVPVCNHIAHAAFTPSRSAELVVPSAGELRAGIAAARAGLGQAPERVERARERVDAACERLRVPDRVEGRRQSVRELAHRLALAEETLFARREAALAQARAVLAALPHRARALTTERERRVAERRSRLGDGSARLGDAGRAMAEHERRLSAGLRRQLADHERDYGRAVARLGSEREQAVARRLRDEEERVGRAAGRAAERSARRLDDAGRDARHAGALVAARDFRRRGYVLAADVRGRPVRSASDLRPGGRLELRLHDGRAGAVVDDVREDER